MTMRNPDLGQLEDRDLALTVKCLHCQAPAGQPCTTTDNTGTHPLENFPAHLGRIRRAQRHQRLIAEHARSDQMPNPATDTREVDSNAPTAHTGRENCTPTTAGPIIGIDPSLTSSGLAILGATPNPTIHLIGQPGFKDDPRHIKGQRIRTIRTRIMNLVPRNTTLAVIEGRSYGHNLPGTDERSHLWWLISDALDHLKIPVAVCPPTTLKKWATDNGAARKPAVITAIERMWPGIQLPENPSAPRAERKADAADALALATIGAQHSTWRMPYPVLERHKLAITKIAWPQ
ncbi:hypothetical protein [Prescottella equi]|uniref:zinc finger domain-containing protein n=1 Tax=Rhodococcus hoagii TaxID=43767 RepID=UPI00111C87C8|nr:hypothetical protein [Prescottella equi]